MKVHEKIREHRENKNLTQAEVAELLDISVPAYSKIERGLTELTIVRLQQLAHIFEINLAELLPEERDVYIQNNHNDSIDNSGSIYFSCGGNSHLLAEIDKLKLIIEHKEVIIVSKDTLIAKLEEQIQDLRELMKK